MQLGMPITTTSGGMRAVSRLMRYPIRTMVPRLQTTPMTTTESDRSMVDTERKKRNRIRAESSTEPSRKSFISAAIRVIMLKRICGSPLYISSSPASFPNSAARASTMPTTVSRVLVLRMRLSSRTPTR
jgi:hypothetical protein